MKDDFAQIKDQAEETVAELLDGFVYEVTGDESLQEIIDLARDEWEADSVWRQLQARRHRRSHTDRAEYRPDDDRLAVDYLRHERTEYDWQLGQISSALLQLEPGDDDGENPMEPYFDELKNWAHAEVRAKTLAAIRERDPELAGAVAKRRDSNYVMSGGQRFWAGRPTYLP